MPPALTSVCFAEAAAIWLESRRPYLAPDTFHGYELNVKTLTTHFGDFRLTEINADMIRLYQKKRLTDTHQRGHKVITCGPIQVNHEVGILQQMLKRVGVWTSIAPDFQPLKKPKPKVGRALSPDDDRRLREAAASRAEWEACYLFYRISKNTTAGPKEVATLRISSIDLHNRTLTVQPEGAKNDGRIRVIPLNDDALEAVILAINRSKRLGALDQEHYIFPFMVRKGRYDHTRYQKSFKQAWRRLRERAMLPYLRMYDLRHHAKTVLLENPNVSEETAETIAGHISPEMKKRYSHIRMDARRNAVSCLDGSTPATKPRQVRDTHATKPPKPEKCPPAVSSDERVAFLEEKLAFAEERAAYYARLATNK